jgi:hypothetical protein
MSGLAGLSPSLCTFRTLPPAVAKIAISPTAREVGFAATSKCCESLPFDSHTRPTAARNPLFHRQFLDTPDKIKEGIQERDLVPGPVLPFGKFRGCGHKYLIPDILAK